MLLQNEAVTGLRDLSVGLAGGGGVEGPHTGPLAESPIAALPGAAGGTTLLHLAITDPQTSWLLFGEKSWTSQVHVRSGERDPGTHTWSRPEQAAGGSSGAMQRPNSAGICMSIALAWGGHRNHRTEASIQLIKTLPENISSKTLTPHTAGTPSAAYRVVPLQTMGWAGASSDVLH